MNKIIFRKSVLTCYLT